MFNLEPKIEISNLLFPSSVATIKAIYRLGSGMMEGARKRRQTQEEAWCCRLGVSMDFCRREEEDPKILAPHCRF